MYCKVFCLFIFFTLIKGSEEKPTSSSWEAEAFDLTLGSEENPAPGSNETDALGPTLGNEGKLASGNWDSEVFDLTLENEESNLAIVKKKRNTYANCHCRLWQCPNHPYDCYCDVEKDWICD